MGYAVALSLAIPLGFLFGLSPLARGLSMPLVRGFPYLPLSAATLVFILWFGIDDLMKVSFLAFAIFVYLLPIIAAEVMDTKSVYINTARTLGASNWQIIMKVYVPDTLARVWDKIVVLVAISWTYIIIVDVINRSKGGIGAMIFIGDRFHRPDMTFALLIILMFVGYCQDRLFRFIGKLLFPHK
jgi:NitT/TauT family transport system permease protein